MWSVIFWLSPFPKISINVFRIRVLRFSVNKLKFEKKIFHISGILKTKNVRPHFENGRTRAIL